MGSPELPDRAVDDYAVAARHRGGSWEVDALPPAVLTDLDELVAAVREQSGDGASMGLVNVGADFFVAVRAGSDTTEALRAWGVPADRVETLLAEGTVVQC